VPTVEEWTYVAVACGAVLSVAAVGALLWKGVKKFLGWADFIDGGVEFFRQAQGRPATRDDPGEPNLMEQVRIMRIEQVRLREMLDELVAWRAGQQPPSVSARRRGQRPL